MWPSLFTSPRFLFLFIYFFLFISPTPCFCSLSLSFLSDSFLGPSYDDSSQWRLNVGYMQYTIKSVYVCRRCLPNDSREHIILSKSTLEFCSPSYVVVRCNLWYAIIAQNLAKEEDTLQIAPSLYIASPHSSATKRILRKEIAYCHENVYIRA